MVAKCVVCSDILDSQQGKALVKTDLKCCPDAAEFLTKYVVSHPVSKTDGESDVCPRCLACVLTCDSILDLFWLKLREFRAVFNGNPVDVDFSLPVDGFRNSDDYVVIGENFEKALFACDIKQAGNAFSEEDGAEFKVERDDIAELELERENSFESSMKQEGLFEENCDEDDEEYIGPNEDQLDDSLDKDFKVKPSPRKRRIQTRSSSAKIDEEYDVEKPAKSRRMETRSSTSNSAKVSKITSKEPDVYEEAKSKVSKEANKRYCVECDQGFPTNVHLYKHYRNSHAKPDGDLCWECGRSFLDPREMSDHVGLHYDSVHGKVSCIDCRRTMAHDGFLLHVTNVHGGVLARTKQGRKESGKKYEDCRFCSFTTVVHNHYEMHMCQAHPDEKPFYCKSCNKEFMLKESLDAHFAKKHLNQARFHCLVCPAKFYGLGEFKEHKRAHKNPNHNYKLCPDCGEIVPRSSYVNHKMRHIKEKGEFQHYECHVCDAKYAANRSLKAHLAKVHQIGELKSNPDLPTACERCGRVFKVKSAWVGHMFKEHGEAVPGLRSFQCGYCSKVFYVRNHYSNHMRKVHGKSTDGHYVCRLCTYAEPEKRGFITHLKNDHGIKATRENFAQYVEEEKPSLNKC